MLRVILREAHVDLNYLITSITRVLTQRFFQQEKISVNPVDRMGGTPLQVDAMLWCAAAEQAEIFLTSCLQKLPGCCETRSNYSCLAVRT